MIASESWSVLDRTGLRLVRCEILSAPGVAHAFSTRLADGRADFDLGPGAGSSVSRVRGRRLCEAAGLRECRPLRVRQVHGARVVGASHAAASTLEADGVVARRREVAGFAPAVRTADCAPVLLVDRSGAAVAALHAGWRGAAAGIVMTAVARLNAMGIPPARLLAAVGPAIGACCYEVGPDVASCIQAALPAGGPSTVQPGRPGRFLLDLGGTIRRQLRAAGLPDDGISAAPWCTRCAAELFFSHRRQAGEAGRMEACVGWTLPPGVA